ncbi:MAG: serine/threonine protein kinase [Acetobacteraceae bacterium]|nr:serine/threonine protein kinase [Acetobacteraceae bacterium]
MTDQTALDDEIWPNDVLARGTTLNGYRIVRLLGRGGFGVTYLAEDLLGQHFALKEYFPRQFAVRHGTQVSAASAADTPVFDDCRSRFVHEARALIGLGRARHGQQDIVRVQTFFEANGTAYMVMEYIVGRTLQAALHEHRDGMPASEIRRILGDILSGLAAVHEAGLMHRDIKPANILLRDGTRAVLIDFGSSREARSTQTHGFTQIFSGGYAPPEQIMGMRQGPFSDIYAVGVIGYEAIGGKVTDSLTRQHAASTRLPDPMPPAAQVGAGRYDAALLGVIDAALSLDPADRPESATAMARTLAEPPPPVVAPPPSAPAPEPPQAGTPPPRAAAPNPPASDPVMHDRPPAPRWPWFAGAGVASLAAALALWLVLGRGPATPPASPVIVAARAPAPAMPPPLPIVLPPLASAPSPPPAPSADQDALLTAAAALPCALLSVDQGEGGTITITGRAWRGAALDDMLRQARAGGSVLTAAIDPLDPALCPPITLLGESYRRERAQETLRLALADPSPAVGTRFAATLQGTGGGMLQVDQYGADGAVHHVLRRPVPSGQWSILLQADAPPPAGQQMLVAMVTTGPLDLGQRPPYEAAADYLPALQRELDRARQTSTTGPRAEILFFQVKASGRQ